jgi:hypothetical protein
LTFPIGQVLRFPSNGTKKRTQSCGGTDDAVGIVLAAEVAIGVVVVVAMRAVTVLTTDVAVGIDCAAEVEEATGVDGETAAGDMENAIAADVEIVVPAGGIKLNDTEIETVVATVVPAAMTTGCPTPPP